MISFMVKEKWFELLERNIKANETMGLNTALESFHGLMEKNISESMKMMKKTEKEK